MSFYDYYVVVVATTVMLVDNNDFRATATVIMLSNINSTGARTTPCAPCPGQCRAAWPDSPRVPPGVLRGRKGGLWHEIVCFNISVRRGLHHRKRDFIFEVAWIC